MKKSVVLKIIYETDEATKQGIINVICDTISAVRSVEEVTE